jgi:hypothetical protein
MADAFLALSLEDRRDVLAAAGYLGGGDEGFATLMAKMDALQVRLCEGRGLRPGSIDVLDR